VDYCLGCRVWGPLDILKVSRLGVHFANEGVPVLALRIDLGPAGHPNVLETQREVSECERVHVSKHRNFSHEVELLLQRLDHSSSDDAQVRLFGDGGQP